MTPFSRLIRNLLEKALGCYREGPNPPSRIAAHVDVFLRVNHNPTIEEWRRFAIDLASSFYRLGYVRGYEWHLREGSGDMSPDEWIDLIDPSGSWRSVSVSLEENNR